MFDPARIIFLHGLESNSQGRKTVVLRRFFPEIIIPDFTGELQTRMDKLYPILGDKDNWTIIGSSFGGLMGALFATAHPQQVRKLILLAPALFLPEFAEHLPQPVEVPTIVYHGDQDTVVPLEITRQLAEKVFRNLTFNVVQDNHGLYPTADSIDWIKLVA
jgi:pimeloyl-ACP methyl ester carboxylesterase